MRQEDLPKVLSGVFLGLSQLGLPALVPSEDQDFVDYLNPSDHSFYYGKGTLDIQAGDGTLGLDMRGIRLVYTIPAKGNFSGSELAATVNARIELSGNNDTGRYSSARLYGNLESYTNIIGNVESSAYSFSTESLGIDIQLDGLIRIPSASGFSANIDSILIQYSAANIAGSLRLDGNFSIGKDRFIADIRHADLNFASSDYGAWSADLSISPLGGFAANITQGTTQVASVTGTPAASLKIEVISGILKRLGVTDSTINLNGLPKDGRYTIAETDTVAQAKNILTTVGWDSVLTGTEDSDVLVGGRGSTRLTGQAEADEFVFESSDEFGRQKSDQITDFQPEQGDRLRLSNRSFETGNRVTLKSVKGKKELNKASIKSYDFVYDKRSGALFYNENQSKRGWGEGGEFVRLLNAPSLSASDISMF